MQQSEAETTSTAVGADPGSLAVWKRRGEVSISYRQYEGEQDLPLIMTLVDSELSEPYSIFTYRYFLHKWPQLCWLAFDGSHCFGTVVSKQDKHGELLRGYIAMLVVESTYRGFGVGTELVRRTIQKMVEGKADEVVLEAEVTNRGALALYQNLGFIRDKYLTRQDVVSLQLSQEGGRISLYYLSGSDAFRLKLMLPLPPERAQELQDEQVVAAELDRMRLEAETSRGGEQPIKGDGLRIQTQGSCESLEVKGHRIGGGIGKGGVAAMSAPSLTKDLSSLPRKKHVKNKSKRTRK